MSEQENGVLSRARERRVFLFEQLVIFSEPIDKKKGLPLPGYTFKNSIKVSPRPRALVAPAAALSRFCCECPASPRSAVWEWRSARRNSLAAWC